MTFSMRPFDKAGVFVPLSGQENELRQLAVRGAGMTLFSGAATLAIQVISTVVLARILAPRDFGLVAMVTTFSLLLVNFGFNGLTEAIIQREHVDQALASALFWINIVGGLVLTVAFAAAGSLLARFYHDAAIREVTRGISLSIIATSISVVHLALLKRAMRFTEVSINDIVARFVSVVAAVVLALMGWQYWALVVAAVVLPLSTSIGALWLCLWVPGFPRKASGIGDSLRFAVHTYGNFCVNYFSRNTDNLLVGWKFNAVALGFYKKAYDLFALSAGQLVSSLTVVVVATLSRLKPGSKQYRRYLISALGTLTFVGMGLAAGLTVGGKDLIRLLLGPKWDYSGTIFTYFAPGIGIMVLYYANGWIHLSIGRADRWFRWAIIEFVVTCGLFILGLHWGPIGIAIAWTVSFWLLTVPALWYAGKPIGLGVGEILPAVWKYIVASLATGFVTVGIVKAFPTLTTIPGARGAFDRLLTDSAIAGFVYLALVVVLHRGIAPIYQIFMLLQEMMPGRKTSPARAFMGDEAMVAYDVPFASGIEQVADPNSLPLVSILIPAYNSQQWIADTLRSAIAQTWPRTEIIVVDDGSKDGTLAIARQFEGKNVRLVTQPNQGASAARNKAFQLSKGDYIQWLDADDLLGPNKITRQMAMVLEQGIGKRTLLSSAWGQFMYRPYHAHFKPTTLWEDLTPVEWMLRKMDQNIFMQTSTWLVSRELTEAAGPWDTRLLGDDDGEYFCRVLLASDGIRFVPDAKVYYRSFQFDSLSYVGRFPQKIEAHWLSMQLHIHYLLSQEDSPRTRAACLQFLRDSLIYFYPEEKSISQAARKMAAELGEDLGEPYLSWKYVWIKALLGWPSAKIAQRRLRRARWTLSNKIDRMLLHIENPERGVSFSKKSGVLTDPQNELALVSESGR
jgi:O-antigen/teichoic acid export membrane protein/glycosyltransferase involved in cell wall biosynthesis